MTKLSKAIPTGQVGSMSPAEAEVFNLLKEEGVFVRDLKKALSHTTKAQIYTHLDRLTDRGYVKVEAVEAA